MGGKSDRKVTSSICKSTQKESEYLWVILTGENVWRKGGQKRKDQTFEIESEFEHGGEC